MLKDKISQHRGLYLQETSYQNEGLIYPFLEKLRESTTSKTLLPERKTKGYLQDMGK